jgi:hypothetical protein
MGPPLSVGAPSFSERIMRAMEVKGLLPNVLRSSLGPVILAGDLTAPEFKWLSRERMYFGSTAQAASPANNQIYELIYGAPSTDTMCIVDSVRIFNREVTSQLWGIYIASAIIGGANSPRVGVNDGRSDGPGNPGSATTPLPAFAASTLSTFQGVQAVPATSPLWEIAAGTSMEILGPWILTLSRFGTILRVHSNSVNVASSVTFKWRERPMLTSETS